MDKILTPPLHDPLPIIIIADQASPLLECPHLRVALPIAPDAGHLLVLLPRLWLSFSSPQPTATLFQLSKPWAPPQLGGAALHLRLHQGSNTFPGQKKTEAKMSYTVHDTGCIIRTSGSKDES